MKLGKAVIDGKTYPLVFSTRVLVNLRERTGKDFGAFLKGAESSTDISEIMRLLADLMKAGAKYADDHGMEHPEPLTFDELLDNVGVDDYGKLFSAMEDLSNDKADLEPISKNV